MNYPEKCIEVFEKNNRWKNTPLISLRKILRDELGVKKISKLRKPELISIAREYFNADTLLSFCKVDGFGFFIKDVAEVLDISNHMAKKIIEEGKIKQNGEVYFSKLNYMAPVYSIKDVILLGESGMIKPKRKSSNLNVVEATPDNLSMALYVLNKSAKKSRDTKQSAYYAKNFPVCNAAKTRSKNLYYLKNAVMKKMIEDGFMYFCGIHQQKISGDIVYLDLYRCGNFTFHNVHTGSVDEEMLLKDIIDDVIDAEVTQKVPINYPQAVALLERYSGEKATGTYNRDWDWY